MNPLKVKEADYHMLLRMAGLGALHSIQEMSKQEKPNEDLVRGLIETTAMIQMLCRKENIPTKALNIAFLALILKATDDEDIVSIQVCQSDKKEKEPDTKKEETDPKE